MKRSTPGTLFEKHRRKLIASLRCAPIVTILVLILVAALCLTSDEYCALVSAIPICASLLEHPVVGSIPWEVLNAFR